jgi:hypothetical protein
VKKKEKALNAEFAETLRKDPRVRSEKKGGTHVLAYGGVSHTCGPKELNGQRFPLSPLFA